MDEADIHRIVTESVNQTLTALGVDVKNPLEFQKDMQHLRSWRESVGTVKKQGLMSAMAVITIGTLGYLWATFKGHL